MLVFCFSKQTGEKKEAQLKLITKTKRNVSAVVSSISGYLILIFFLQKKHFPPRKR